MAEHTKGPWRVRACLGGYFIEGPGGANERVVRGSGGVKELQDAILIAAAPDLLVACEMVLDYFFMDTGEFEAKHGAGMATRALDYARAAIAKARGSEASHAQA